MSSGTRIAVLALSLALVTGCATRHPRTAPPPVAQIPSLPPVQMAELVSPLPPVFPPVKERPVKLDTTAPPETKEEEATVEAPHPVRRIGPNQPARTRAAGSAEDDRSSAGPNAGPDRRGGRHAALGGLTDRAALHLQ